MWSGGAHRGDRLVCARVPENIDIFIHSKEEVGYTGITSPTLVSGTHCALDFLRDFISVRPRRSVPPPFDLRSAGVGRSIMTLLAPFGPDRHVRLGVQ